MTVDQWAELADGEVKTELVNGEIVEVARGTYKHNRTRDRILRHIGSFLLSLRIGEAVVEQAFRVAPDNGRIPDVAFMTFERLGSFDQNRSVLPFVPNLCVEVVSPSESALDLRDKVHEYLDNGAETVWLIYLDRREADIWERGVGMRVVTDTLRASCLPGLEIPLSAVIE